MHKGDALLPAAGTLVVDSFSLYSIVTAHGQDGADLQRSAREGGVRLVASSVALAVASSMSNCWDSECDREHLAGSGNAVRDFHERGAVEVAELTPAEALSAARLYTCCAARRIGGAEVLAACHSVLLAGSRAAPLVSTGRAAYCYTAIPEVATGPRITLL